MVKRPSDCTPEENAVYAGAEKVAWFAKLKEKPKKFPDTPEEHAKVVAMLKARVNLTNGNVVLDEGCTQK